MWEGDHKQRWKGQMYSGEASSMWEGQLAKAKNKCRKLVEAKREWSGHWKALSRLRLIDPPQLKIFPGWFIIDPLFYHVEPCFIVTREILWLWNWKGSFLKVGVHFPLEPFGGLRSKWNLNLGNTGVPGRHWTTVLNRQAMGTATAFPVYFL